MTDPSPTPSTDLDPVSLLAHRFRKAMAQAFPAISGDMDPLIAPNKNPAAGDFQSNAAMGLSKRVGKPPRDAAKAIVAALNVDDLCEPVTEAAIAGPGFINLRLRSDALARLATGMDSPTFGVALPAAPMTIVVDLCGVNLAKEMHVGHLRSTIIGDAMARIFDRLGHRVFRQNHLGDWGLPIAMVCGRVKREVQAGRLDLATIVLTDLDKHYKAAQKECAPPASLGSVLEDFAPFLTSKFMAEWADEIDSGKTALAALAVAKKTLVDLQAKEPGILKVWQRIVDVTIAACAENCRRLGAIVLPEHTAGESSYAEELGPVVEDLLARKIAEIDDGAVVVRLDVPELVAAGEAVKEPCLIRKRDGGYLYATTDVAAIKRRVQSLGADRVVYCVDARQGFHFKQVFAAAKRAGYATRHGHAATLTHAAFGTILGDDGRPFKTRTGENVKLSDLISEGVSRAGTELKSRTGEGVEVNEAEFDATAWAVGVAAIKYADLSIERVKDYAFSFDRMVAFEGNTGPYLLYAYARTRSIFRKAAEQGIEGGGIGGWRAAPIVLGEPAERALALTMLKYPGALAAAGEAAEPHRLCQFLYELAGSYSAFYTNCPILTAETPAVRASRLRLCDLASRLLADGLKTLGLPVVEKM
jgi:arginyl-tRNA synthetase